MNISGQEARLVARKAADYLFTNGNGDRAKRLVLELSGGKDGGGWCYDAVIAGIMNAICDVVESR